MGRNYEEHKEEHKKEFGFTDRDPPFFFAKPADALAALSTFVELRAGDLIYTGTPAGVGPVSRGDRLEGGVDGLGVLVNTFV